MGFMVSGLGFRDFTVEQRHVQQELSGVVQQAGCRELSPAPYTLKH